jgi:signal transduction histidine kinase
VLDVRYHVTGSGHPLPVRIEAGVFRLAQEALTNVARHAQANQVTVELSVDADFLRLSVVDNGNGFDPTGVSGGHFGLIGLRERTRLLSGSLKLLTSPGNGTELRVRIPLREGKAAE